MRRIQSHEWETFFPPAPRVSEPLDSGPFDKILPTDPGVGRVEMMTSPTDEYIPNWGMGYQIYALEESGPPPIENEDPAESIRKLAEISFASNIYMRLDWRDIQKEPGRLDFPETWKLVFDLAEELDKQISFRIQLANTTIYPLCSTPEFVLERSGGVTDTPGRIKLPHYEHPEFLAAFRDLNRMLAKEFDSHPRVEFMDLMGYGAWGEWHSGRPGHCFPDTLTASRTLVAMVEEQLDAWVRTPLVMVAHQDTSGIRLRDVIATAVQGGCWLRRDNVTCHLHSIDLHMMTRRPEWTAAVIEDGRHRRYELGNPERDVDSGVHILSHEMMRAVDVRANYWALWQCADNILHFREEYPRGFQILDRHLGYKVRPAWVFVAKDRGRYALIIAVRNDGCAWPPGILRIRLANEAGTLKLGGGFRPGTPAPSQVQQGRIVLPEGIDWQGLKLSAEIEVNGIRHPAHWACQEPLNPDGSLTLRPTNGLR